MADVDVVVIGAGLIGLAVARELRREGLQVAIYEQGHVGREASWAGGGMLSAVQVELDSPLRPLGLASAHRYPAFVAELREETGLPIEFRANDTLFIGEREEIPAEFERLDEAQIGCLEPALRAGEPVWRVPDGRVDNRQLVAALTASARARGVEIVEQCGVRKVERNGSGLVVSTDAGLRRAARVVNAAGAWAGTFEAPVAAPVRPRKGQMLCLRTEPGAIRNVLVRNEGGKVYVVPRADGRVLIGATMEDVGFHRRVEPMALQELRNRAEAMVPLLRDAAVVENWAGLRPGSDDLLPLLGPTEAPGYWMATGHFRDGILLTPITAHVIAEWMVRGAVAGLDLSAFRPGRFAGDRAEQFSK